VLLVTRPGEEGPLLAARLRQARIDALWWPAFDFLAGADDAARRALASLGSYDLVVFVSPEAARAAARICAAAPGGLRWPGAVRIGATGAGTLAALAAGFEGIARAQAWCAGTAAEGSPAGGPGQGGSEALWTEIEAAIARGEAPVRRALVVRAGHGREWLAGQLQSQGAEVEYAAVYRRETHSPLPSRVAALRALDASGGVAAILYSSSEAVAVVLRQLRAARPERPWPGSAVALCLHERIREAAREAGHVDARACGADPESIGRVLRARSI
jgi:uroporphyrinogen-III synthase